MRISDAGSTGAALHLVCIVMAEQQRRVPGNCFESWAAIIISPFTWSCLNNRTRVFTTSHYLHFLQD
ncbi:hypothetical protein GDO81_013899 [Engystomops pustulosus]|uniref:Uncharacterized protein n=1 Tax=Engystomops pustulosus TaxID=76066 RepID=A0AAV7B6E5_ENGPU|nr:hypothetical protein GDO81_013899 [Engystomops pustulosus]